MSRRNVTSRSQTFLLLTCSMNVIFLGCGGCSGLLSIDVLDDLRDRVASEEALEPLLLQSYNC